MTSSSENLRRALVVLALLALWGGATWFKATRVLENASFSLSDDTAMFWGEDALRYRCAKMLAAGMALPAQDKALGWPKGQDTYAEDSWVMEKLAAIAYREVTQEIGAVPFHVFLLWWWSALTTLAVWPIYALSRRVWNQRLAGIASACLWASAFGGLHATAGPRLAVTDVALPWLFLTVHFFMTAVGSRQLWRALVAAGCCWWTLTIWPGAMWFLLLMMALGAAIDFHHLSFDLVTELRPGETARTILGRSLYVPVALLVLAIVGAGLTVPTLQAQGTAWSLPVCFGGVWVVLGGILRVTRLPLPDRWRVTDGTAVLMPPQFRRRRRLISIGLYATTFAALIASVLALEWWRGSQSSAFTLLVRVAASKLMYFGQMPLQPYVLDDDVRLLWSLVAQSPAAATWWLSAAGLIVLMPLAIALPFIQARHSVGAIGIASGARVTLPFERALQAALAGSFSVLWLLVARLDGCFAWAAAVTGGALVDFALNVGRYPPLWRLGNRPRFFAAALLAAALTANLAGLRIYNGADNAPPQSQLLALVKQIRYRTELDAPLAAPVQLSGMLAADTGRPVLWRGGALDGDHRAALLEFYKVLFGPEKELAAYCRGRSVRYLVADVETLTAVDPGHARYNSNHPAVSENCAAYRLHFTPEKLRCFQLVYTGPLFRLYRVLAANEQAPAVAPTPLAQAYFPTWDRANYSTDRLRLLPEK
ncbi:MAG: hypothetical protein HZA88_24385 [Verrucomicrobia bacterium]|nr:hypothetical protein [Verrucomicrobiota bacterium]